jgi:hypothetical protein
MQPQQCSSRFAQFCPIVRVMLEAPAARPIGCHSRRAQHMQAWQAGFTLLQRGIVQLDGKHDFPEWWLGYWVRLRLICFSSSLLTLALKLTGACPRDKRRCLAGIMQRCFAMRLHFNFENDCDNSDSFSDFGDSDGFVTDDDDEDENIPETPEPGFRVKSGSRALKAKSFSAL